MILNSFINEIRSDYRDFLDEEEGLVEHLETKLEKTIKMCTLAVDSGKEYIKNQRWVTRIGETLDF